MKELFAVPDELHKMMELIATQRSRLEADMGLGPNAVPGMQAKGGPNKDQIYCAKELAAAYATLGKELRQWSGHLKSSLDSMTPARKAQVMVQFIQDCPLGIRRDLYAVLATLEGKRPDGLKLSVSDPFGTPAQVEAPQ